MRRFKALEVAGIVVATALVTAGLVFQLDGGDPDSVATGTTTPMTSAPTVASTPAPSTATTVAAATTTSLGSAATTAATTTTSAPATVDATRAWRGLAPIPGGSLIDAVDSLVSGLDGGMAVIRLTEGGSEMWCDVASAPRSCATFTVPIFELERFGAVYVAVGHSGGPTQDPAVFVGPNPRRVSRLPTTSASMMATDDRVRVRGAAAGDTILMVAGVRSPAGTPNVTGPYIALTGDTREWAVMDPTEFGSFAPRTVAFIDGQFVLPGDDIASGLSVVWLTEDGERWRQVALDANYNLAGAFGLPGALYVVGSGGEVFEIRDGDQACRATAADGCEAVRVSAVGPDVVVTDALGVGDVAVVVGGDPGSGEAAVWTSRDAISWEESHRGGAGVFRAAASGPDGVIAVGDPPTAAFTTGS